MSNPNFTVLDFGVDGTIEAMHREDLIDLSALGPQDITRASELIHDKWNNVWGIAIPGDNCGTRRDGEWWIAYEIQDGFKTYKDCREIEVDWLEHARLHAVHPQSAKGYDLLNEARARHGYATLENPMLEEYRQKMDRMFGGRKGRTLIAATVAPTRRKSDHEGTTIPTFVDTGTGAYVGPFPD